MTKYLKPYSKTKTQLVETNINELNKLNKLNISMKSLEPWQSLTPPELIFYHQTTPEDPMCLTAIVSLSCEATERFIYDKFLPLILQHPRFLSYINPKTTKFEKIPALKDYKQGDKSFDLSKVIASNIEFQSSISASLSPDERYDEFLNRMNTIISSYIPISNKNQLLWKLFIIPSFSFKYLQQSSKQYSTIIFHIHHCLSDGIGLLKFLVSNVIDENSVNDQLLVPNKHLNKNKKLDINTEMDDEEPNQSKSLIPPPPNPNSPLVYIPDFFKSLYNAGIRSAIPEIRNALNRKQIQPLKQCYFTRPDDETKCLSIPYLKQLSRKLNISINDLIYVSISNAVAKHLEKYDENKQVLKKNLRCSLSVNQTVIEKEYDLKDVGNYVGLIPVPLHNHTMNDNSQKLIQCVNTMRFLKRSPYVHMCQQLLKLFTILPTSLIRPTWLYFTRGATTFFSNVAGPQSPVTICNGVKVDDIHFVPVVGGYMGAVVSIMSYNNSLHIGVASDRTIVQAPEALIELIKNELSDICTSIENETINEL